VLFNRCVSATEGVQYAPWQAAHVSCRPALNRDEIKRGQVGAGRRTGAGGSLTRLVPIATTMRGTTLIPSFTVIMWACPDKRTCLWSAIV
jgi:hypothetical protein